MAKYRHMETVLIDLAQVEWRISNEGCRPSLTKKLAQLKREYLRAVDRMILAEEAGALIKLPPEELRALRKVGSA